jgi:hypothetical protein
MTQPIRPSAPAAKPVAPIAAVAPPIVAAPVAADVSSIEVTTGILIESNDVVGAAAPATLDSVVSKHPVGIQVETFLGLQPNVAWVDPNAVVPAEAQ